VPPGIDTGKANTARVYDYWLGGSNNFLPLPAGSYRLAGSDMAARCACGPPARRSADQARR
jgi:S-adenosyl methyltransferase